MNFNELMFSELRAVPVHLDPDAEIKEQRLVKAVTANEEIMNLGYTLSPKDIIALSKSADLDSFCEHVRSCVGDVKAKPMYPNYPEQVMEMDEAVFRFHQLLHYMSTYGIEEITGADVTRGWLPDQECPEKNVMDETLLHAKVISLIECGECYKYAYSKILSKTERMTGKEKMMILECVKNMTPEEMCSVSVKFKQNLLDVFNTVFCDDSLSAGDKLGCLRCICQHTGDIWKCVDYALTKANFHFRTSQKRLIVRLLESYPVSDLKANLILSNKKGERTLLMLKFIDFNEYSRSEEHKKIVAQFRSGELRSWESRAKYLVNSKAPEAVDYYGDRPGIMLRNLTYLLRNGYSAKEISAKLTEKADSLSTQTIVSLMSFFARPAESWENSARHIEAQLVYSMLAPLLNDRLRANKTLLSGRKVYIDMPGFDLEHSAVRVTNKSTEGGYIRSGLAYRIPDDAEKIRFFIYWNDKERVDVDLHASARTTDGSDINIGWNEGYKTKGGTLVFSGDITHSNAAEYIDIDLVKGKNSISTVSANIDLYSGYDSFGEIDECFVGAMAVKQTGEKIRHYDPKNCFFTHYLTGKYRTLNYGYVDVQNRVIVFDGLETNQGYYSAAARDNAFSLKDYLEILFRAQGAVSVDNSEEADVVLVMGKPSDVDGKEVSLIDNNFFMESENA